MIIFETLHQKLHRLEFNIIKRKPNKSGFSVLYIFCRINGKQCFVPTKIKILSHAWDADKERITAAQVDHTKLNGILTKSKALLQSVFDDLDYLGIEPTVEGVKERFKDKRRPGKKDPVVKSEKVTVAELLFKHERDYKNIKAKGYLRKFGTFARALNTYAEEKEVCIDADQFDLTALNKYINDYLVDVLELENSSIFDHVRKIRFVMKNHPGAHKDCIHFKWKYTTPKPVWLDWGTGDMDLEKLEEYECSEEDVVYKKEFLFRCYSGLRWSDCHQLEPHHFIKKKDGVEIDFSAIKTHNDQNLLLSSKAAAIAKEWKYKVPKLSISECNARIKVILKGAKVHRVMEKVRHSGSKRKVDMLPKWAMVTTHVARRTFGRRWVDLGGDVIKLMKYYGHRTPQQTMDYVGHTTKEVNNEMKRLFG